MKATTNAMILLMVIVFGAIVGWQAGAPPAAKCVEVAK